MRISPNILISSAFVVISVRHRGAWRGHWMCSAVQATSPATCPDEPMVVTPAGRHCDTELGSADGKGEAGALARRQLKGPTVVGAWRRGAHNTERGKEEVAGPRVPRPSVQGEEADNTMQSGGGQRRARGG
nr:unnamed protein product [Digitaria exilis]